MESAAEVRLRDERTRPQDQFPAYRDTQLTLKACRQIGHQFVPHRHWTLPSRLCVRILEWFCGEDELRLEVVAGDRAKCSGTACRGGAASRPSRLGIFFFYSDPSPPTLTSLSQFRSFPQRSQLFCASFAVKEGSRTFEAGKRREVVAQNFNKRGGVWQGDSLEQGKGNTAKSHHQGPCVVAAQYILSNIDMETTWTKR